MNILEVEDMVKGLPDQALFKEAEQPSGQVPQFLVVSEIQRRTDMRKRYQEQQPNKGTVKDQIVQQGIMGIMPQPPMPQQMPAQGMPPQGMPPQQMFSGGIVRLQEGGFLDQMTISGAGTVRSQIDRALDLGASTAELLSMFDQPEAQEYILNKARSRNVDILNDPSVSDLDKAMIASERSKDIVADEVGSRMNYFQPPKFIGDMVEAGVNAYRNIPSQEDIINSLREALPKSPPRQQGPSEASRGYAEQLNSIRSGIAGITNPIAESFSEASQRSLEDASGRRQGVVDFFSGLEDSLTPESVERARQGLPMTRDPMMFESAANYGDLGPFDKYYDLKPGQVPAPDPLSEELLLSMPSNDASAKDLVAGDDLFSAQEMRDLTRKNAQTQGTNDASVQGDGRTPALDLSDLIAESRSDALSNALMQLGAGIAGGDVSKGIAASGQALTEGQQQAKAIAMRGRLAEYEAGREDLARGEKARQFDEQMNLLERKIDATLAASDATTNREFVRTLSSELASLRENMALMTPAEKERLKRLEALLDSQFPQLSTDLPQNDVVSGLSGKDTQGLSSFLR